MEHQKSNKIIIQELQDTLTYWREKYQSLEKVVNKVIEADSKYHKSLLRDSNENEIK